MQCANFPALCNHLVFAHRFKMLSVGEIMSKSKKWHAARREGGDGDNQWGHGYMRKQFPASWFLSGSTASVSYAMDSPIPLSYHGDNEMLSYLPEILHPRYPPPEHWTPETNSSDSPQKTANKGTNSHDETQQNQNEVKFTNVESRSSGSLPKLS